MRALVIEDQPQLRNVIVESLREEAFATDSSADGEEGLYKALNWDYDFVVLDIMLPKLDGREVLRKLRARKNTPVLMLTALDGVNDKVTSLNDGADDFLVKPFAMPELIARCRALVRRNLEQRNPRLQVGEVEINTATRSVTASGKDVELTAKEYALAALLIQRKDQIVTRDEIHEHLFDENDESMSNVLDVYMCKIRRKLGKDFVRTRRGHGYIVESV